MIKFQAKELRDFRMEVPDGKDIYANSDLSLQKGVRGEHAERTVLHSLDKNYYKIDKVERGPETKIDGTTLVIREGIEEEVVKSFENVLEFSLDILTEKDYHTYSDTIMDVQPIAAKVGEDMLGEGTTNVLDGVVMMLTGCDETGVQIGEFGSSEGYIDENIVFGRPGAPDKGDILIRAHVTIPKGKNMERPGPFAAHSAMNYVTEEIRKELKKLEPEDRTRTEHFEQTTGGKHRILIAKEIMGQGAMHDHLLLPMEPAGVLGGVSNIDLGNMPVCVTPLEVLDGCVHSMTCVGPASKEVSRHFFREPLITAALEDEDIEVVGVVLVGSSQINTEKYFTSRRFGALIEQVKPDGVIITTEGFGNNHIDFASHNEQIGMRGIPSVGMSFCAVQGALVVGNKYMSRMVELNKSELGVENEVLACNTLCREDALRAIVMMKDALEDVDVDAADRKWSKETEKENMDRIDKKAGMKTERAASDDSIPLSEKRIKKYGLKKEDK